MSCKHKKVCNECILEQIDKLENESAELKKKLPNPQYYILPSAPLYPYFCNGCKTWVNSGHYCVTFVHSKPPYLPLDNTVWCYSKNEITNSNGDKTI